MVRAGGIIFSIPLFSDWSFCSYCADEGDVMSKEKTKRNWSMLIKYILLGLTYKELAAEYEVTPSRVRLLVINKLVKLWDMESAKGLSMPTPEFPHEWREHKYLLKFLLLLAQRDGLMPKMPLPECLGIAYGESEEKFKKAMEDE